MCPCKDWIDSLCISVVYDTQIVVLDVHLMYWYFGVTMCTCSEFEYIFFLGHRHIKWVVIPQLYKYWSISSNKASLDSSVKCYVLWRIMSVIIMDV